MDIFEQCKNTGLNHPEDDGVLKAPQLWDHLLSVGIDANFCLV